MAGDRFVPPAPVGTPYRSDPADPAPFLTEDDKVPVVPVEPAPYRDPDVPSPSPYGGPDVVGPPRDHTQPVVRVPLTKNQEYARNAFWIGIASIFVFGVILGPIAVYMGIRSIDKGEREVGRKAVICGSIGIVLAILAIVLSALGVIPPLSEMWDKAIKKN